MRGNVSSLVKLSLMLLILMGVWLASYSDTRLLPGLLLGFGAAAGLLLLEFS